MLKLQCKRFCRYFSSVLFFFLLPLLAGCASVGSDPASVVLANGEQTLEVRGWVKEISSDRAQLVLSRLNKERITVLLTEQTVYARIPSATEIGNNMNLRVLYLEQEDNIALLVEQLPYLGCDKP